MIAPRKKAIAGMSAEGYDWSSRIRPPALRVLEDSLTVMDVASAPLWCVDPGSSIESALAELTYRHYDVAPLDEIPLRRCVERETLASSASGRATVSDVAVPMDATCLVSSSVSLLDTLWALKVHPYAFVLDRSGVSAVVTRSDLQHPNVSIALLGLVIGCEPALDSLIYQAYGEGWIDVLSPPRAEAIRAMFNDRQGRSLEVRLLNCSNLDDRTCVMSKSPQLFKELGFTSRSGFDKWATRMKRARDAMAHGGDLLQVEKDSQSALDFVEQLVAFSGRVWELSPEPNAWP